MFLMPYYSLLAHILRLSIPCTGLCWYRYAFVTSSDVIKPLQSMLLVSDDGKPAHPCDPFVMAIMVRQKSFNFGSIVLNKMGEKSEQFTKDSSVVRVFC